VQWPNWGSEKIITLTLGSGTPAVEALCRGNRLNPSSISGGWWKNTFVTIVINYSFNRLKEILFTKGNWIRYRINTDHPSIGNIGSFVGWELIGQDLGRFRRSYRWRNSAPGSTKSHRRNSRERSYTFWLMHIWCGACRSMVANLAQMKNISPSIFVQIIIALRDLFLA